MIADLKPYPKYKESGLPWLGQVPGHWETRPAFGAFVPNHERNRAMKEKTVLSLSYGRIVIKPAEKLHGLVPESFETYQIVNPGDIILRTVDLQNDHTSLRVGMVRDRGIITSAYLALRVNAGVNTDFGFQFLNVWDSSKAIYGYGSGLRQNLDFAHFKRMPVAVPPPAEQAAIVRFLDWANGRLERAIRAKRKVIALLNEQKQAIIHRAVTRGLDPSVPLKPSGIPWLGDIPRHWELWRISRFARVGNGSTPSRGKPAYWNGGIYPWLNSSQVNRSFIDNADQFVTQAALRECHLPRVPAGSVLVAITGQGKTRGMSAMLGMEATINQHIAYITPRVPVASSEYIHLALSAAYLQLRALSEDSGSTKGAITCEDLKRFKLALPPGPEQEQLFKHVQTQTRGLVTAISRLEREIELFREYRTRLVADVVTGKLDVREAAAKLPEETDKPEPLNDADALTEGDEETGDADLDAVTQETEA
jgi:type I restriction enzyme S subunit